MPTTQSVIAESARGNTLQTESLSKLRLWLIFDVIELAELLGRVLREEADPAIIDLDDQFRRLLNVEYVQQQTVATKKRLEEKDPETRMRNNQTLRATIADPVAHRAYLLRASLIDAVF